MIIVNTPGSWSYVYPPLLHAKWHGCTPTDLVFPFFLFIVGITLSISLGKILQKHASDPLLKSRLLKKITKRAVLIFVVGIFLNWFPFYHMSISDLRIMGVLQRIALSFAGAAILVIYLKDSMKLLITLLILLLVYWLVLLYLGGSAPYSLESNIAGKIDPFIFGPTHVYNGYGIPFDPEGLLSTIPSIAHVIIGYLFGNIILDLKEDKKKLVSRLLIYGTIMTILGFLWNLVLPLNKSIWTSSYVVFTCGISAIFLAILMWLIEIKKIEKWSYVFKVFGLNPLFSYVLSGVLVNLMIYTFIWNGTDSLSWLYDHVYQTSFGNYLGSFLFALSFTLAVWLLTWPLYIKGKIIKL